MVGAAIWKITFSCSGQRFNQGEAKYEEDYRIVIYNSGRCHASPGGPEEDRSGGFKYGGWTVGYWDDLLSNIMDSQMSEPFELYWEERHTRISPHTGPMPKVMTRLPLNSTVPQNM